MKRHGKNIGLVVVVLLLGITGVAAAIRWYDYGPGIQLGGDREIGQVYTLPVFQSKHSSKSGADRIARDLRWAIANSPAVAKSVSKGTAYCGTDSDQWVRDAARVADYLIMNGLVAASSFRQGEKMLVVIANHEKWNTANRQWIFDASNAEAVRESGCWRFYVTVDNVVVKLAVPYECGNLVILSARFRKPKPPKPAPTPTPTTGPTPLEGGSQPAPTPVNGSFSGGTVGSSETHVGYKPPIQAPILIPAPKPTIINVNVPQQKFSGNISTVRMGGGRVAVDAAVSDAVSAAVAVVGGPGGVSAGAVQGSSASGASAAVDIPWVEVTTYPQ